MVNVWGDEYKLSFGQLQADKKSNEITVMPDLTDLIECAGSVSSIDTMGCQKQLAAKGCQKQIAAKIIACKADYVIALKANQGLPYKQVTDFMEKRKATLPAYPTVDKAHERGEKRTIYLADSIALVDQAM